MKFKAGEPDEASDAKRTCTDNEDNKCFLESNFSLCSNQSNHRTAIDCLSFQQEIRDGPFNFQGGLWFFSKQIFWFPMLLKKIFWFWWREKKSVSEFLSYNLMLNFGEKKLHFVRQKNKYYNSHVVRENFSEWSKKP